MAYRLRYRPKAVEQIDAIFTYIATRNRPAAHRVIGAIKRRIEQLADFPYSSRPSEVPGNPLVADRALSLHRLLCRR